MSSALATVASEHNELVKAVLARDIAKSISLLNTHVRTTGQFARAAGEKSSVEVT
jgi:DNA-binding GntR family transcriptional regulator